MIENRPKALLAGASYRTLPKTPLVVDWTSVPELIRVAMLDLGGVQPVTRAMAEAAGGTLRDKPSSAEITLFQARKTTFQMVSVVASCVAAGASNGILQVKPFSITLVPASKRGEVDERPIDAIAAIDVDGWLASQPMYARYDPFSGDWGMYGNLPGYLDGEGEGFLDEVGIVVDQYYLATATPEDDEILTLDLRMPSEDMKARYERHRKNLLFKPFKKIEARRVWGVETPRELFLVQALAKENLFPQCQMFIMEDGAVFPAWYHLWQDVEFRHSVQPVTESDLFFPEERVAVFCDGAHHSRGKNKAKDAAIDAKLKNVGIRPIRILGTEINFNLPAAVARVQAALM